jgi:uncharacterized integral membrane protein
MTRPPYPQQPWDGQQRPPTPPTPPGAPTPAPVSRGPYQPQQGPPSAPQQTQPPTHQPSSAFKISGKQIAAGILGVLALIFILENNSTTRVRLIIPIVHLPLFIALFLSAVLGAAVTFLLMWRRQRVEERKQQALHQPGPQQPPGRNLNG